MKVICIHLPTPVDGTEIEWSPWVTLHAEYLVVSLLAKSGGRVELQIICDDGQSLGWFDSINFTTADSSIPRNWTAHLTKSGVLELGPAAWLAPGFWEAYYDGDPGAAESVATELATILP